MTDIPNNKFLVSVFKFFLDINMIELKYNITITKLILLKIPIKKKLKKAIIEKSRKEQLIYFNFLNVKNYIVRLDFKNIYLLSTSTNFSNSS